jgi:hypothetical protein
MRPSVKHIAVLHTLAACGPVASNPEADATGDPAATTTTATATATTDTGAPSSTEPAATTPDATTTAASTTDASTTDASTTDAPTTGAPVEPPGCWQLDLQIAEGSRNPALAIAPRADGFVLGASPTLEGLSLLADGAIIWEESVDPGEPVVVHDVVPVADDATLVFGGRAEAILPSGVALWMARVADDGTITGDVSLGPGHADVWAHVDARPHPDGGFYVSNDAFDPDFGGLTIALTRVDADGQFVWRVDSGLGPGVDVAVNWSLGAMDVLPGGDAVQITAASDGVRVLRTAPDGEVLWERVYFDHGWPRDIVALPGDEIAVLASTTDTAELLRLDGAGDVLATHSYTRGPGSNGTSLAFDGEHLLIAGGTRGAASDPQPGAERSWLFVTDLDGVVDWVHVGDPLSPSHTNEARALGPGSFVLTAHSDGLWVARLDRCP